MCKSEPVCHRGYLVRSLFRDISMKREEQNNRHEQAALNKNNLGNMHREIFKDNFGICFYFLISTTHSNNEIRRVDVGSLQPGKEVKNKLATVHSDKHGKKYVKHHIHGEKNKHLGEKGKDVIEQIRRRKWTWAVRM